MEDHPGGDEVLLSATGNLRVPQTLILFLSGPLQMMIRMDMITVTHWNVLQEKMLRTISKMLGTAIQQEKWWTNITLEKLILQQFLWRRFTFHHNKRSITQIRHPSLWLRSCSFWFPYWFWVWRLLFDTTPRMNKTLWRVDCLLISIMFGRKDVPFFCFSFFCSVFSCGGLVVD